MQLSGEDGTCRGHSICSTTRSRREPPRHSSCAMNSESFWTLSGTGPGAKPSPTSPTMHLRAGTSAYVSNLVLGNEHYHPLYCVTLVKH